MELTQEEYYQKKREVIDRFSKEFIDSYLLRDAVLYKIIDLLIRDENPYVIIEKLIEDRKDLIEKLNKLIALMPPQSNPFEQ